MKLDKLSALEIFFLSFPKLKGKSNQRSAKIARWLRLMGNNLSDEMTGTFYGIVVADVVNSAPLPLCFPSIPLDKSEEKDIQIYSTAIT